MNTIYLEPKMIPAHLRGGYNGTKFRAEIVTEYTIPADSGLWDGGSRDTYQLVHLDTGRAVQASNNMSAPWDGSRKDRHVRLEPGFALIRHTISCGKDMGLTYLVHPDNAAKLLPAPAEALSANEQIVINATCSLKSSYGGRDRYQMACEDMDRREPLMTRAEWDAAKQSLIAKGLLNKAGAVTVAGRNQRTRD